MASVGAKVAAEKAHKQHIFDGERAQAFSDAIYLRHRRYICSMLIITATMRACSAGDM